MAKLFLNGAMGGGFFGDDNKIIEQVKAVPDNEELELQVTTPGGSTTFGNVLYNAVMNHPGRTTYKAVGLVASMGTVMMGAFDEVLLEEGVLLMFHKGYLCTGYDDEEYQPDAGEKFVIDSFNKQAHARLVAKGGDKAFLDKVFLSEKDVDYWMEAHEAASLGFGTVYKIDRDGGMPTEVLASAENMRELCNSEKKELHYNFIKDLNVIRNKKRAKTKPQMNLFSKKKSATPIKMADGTDAVLNSKYGIPIKGDTIAPAEGDKKYHGKYTLANNLEVTLVNGEVIDVGEPSDPPAEGGTDTVSREDFDALEARVKALEDKKEGEPSDSSASDAPSDNADKVPADAADKVSQDIKDIKEGLSGVVEAMTNMAKITGSNFVPTTVSGDLPDAVGPGLDGLYDVKDLLDKR